MNWMKSGLHCASLVSAIVLAACQAVVDPATVAEPKAPASLTSEGGRAPDPGEGNSTTALTEHSSAGKRANHKNNVGPPVGSNDATFTFDFTDEHTYLSSVMSLRNSDLVTSPLLSGIRVLPIANDLLRISITGLDSSDFLQLVLRRRDLYVVGFIADRRIPREGLVGRFFYRFSDETGVNLPDFDPAHTVTLNSPSTYPRLERIALQHRRDMQINPTLLDQDRRSLTQLGNGNLTSNSARALLRFIVSVSESLRFPEISAWVVDSLSYTTVDPMGIHREALTNEWGGLSQYARGVAQNPAMTFVGREAWERNMNQTLIPTVLAIAACASTNGPRNAMVRGAVSQCDDSYNVTINNRQYDKDVFWVYIKRIVDEL